MGIEEGTGEGRKEDRVDPQLYNIYRSHRGHDNKLNENHRLDSDLSTFKPITSY